MNHFNYDLKGFVLSSVHKINRPPRCIPACSDHNLLSKSFNLRSDPDKIPNGVLTRSNIFAARSISALTGVFVWLLSSRTKVGSFNPLNVLLLNVFLSSWMWPRVSSVHLSHFFPSCFSASLSPQLNTKSISSVSYTCWLSPLLELQHASWWDIHSSSSRRTQCGDGHQRAAVSWYYILSPLKKITGGENDYCVFRRQPPRYDSAGPLGEPEDLK